MKHPLTMMVQLDSVSENAGKDVEKFLSRLVAKCEGRLHAKEDTYTLAYLIVRRLQMMLAKIKYSSAFPKPTVEFELSYAAAEALNYELKSYPGRKPGILVDILTELQNGLREKRQHDVKRKREAKRRNRPSVRKARGF